MRMQPLADAALRRLAGAAGAPAAGAARPRLGMRPGACQRATAASSAHAAGEMQFGRRRELAMRCAPPQRAGPSKVALRRKPAGICSADAPPSWRCAASNSSRRGSRIMTPALRLAGEHGAGLRRQRRPAAALAARLCRREAARRQFQPMAATAATDATPATSFQRKLASLAASAGGDAAPGAHGAPGAARPLAPLQPLLQPAQERRRRRCRRPVRPSAARRRSGGRCARPRAPLVGRSAAVDAARELLAPQLAVGQRGNQFLRCASCPSHHLAHSPPHQRLPDWFSSRGLTFAEIASRARKIRERTVPIGQFITSAISS